MSRRRFTWSQAVTFAALVAQAVGCTAWHTESGVTPSELMEPRHPSRPRVELLSGRREGPGFCRYGARTNRASN
jgi:hypothetical protein